MKKKGFCLFLSAAAPQIIATPVFIYPTVPRDKV